LELLGIPYTLLDGSVAARVAQVRAVLGWYSQINHSKL
jgi:hypothetical protein